MLTGPVRPRWVTPTPAESRAVALSLVVRINEAYGTIEEDELREVEREEEA